MNTLAQYVLHSLLFFTRIPVGRFVKINDKTLIASRILLPFVGLLLGLLAAILFSFLLSHNMPKSVSLLTTLLFLVLLTGAFHEDGLADSIDAFGGGNTRKRILEILKDSRVGTYGSLALIFFFGLKFFILYEMPIDLIAPLLIFSEAASRFSALPLMWKLPYPRNDTAFEKSFHKNKSLVSFERIFIVFMLLLLLGVYLFKEIGILMMISILVVSYITGFYYQKRIHGATGDCYGATICISQIVLLLIALFIAQYETLPY